MSVLSSGVSRSAGLTVAVSTDDRSLFENGSAGIQVNESSASCGRFRSLDCGASD